MSSTSIIPECYVDTILIETLVPPKDGKGYNHQKGCPLVAKTMMGKFADRFALGIMDKDKKTVKYLENFCLAIESGSLFLYKHKTRPHYIILIDPACERFILRAADELGISLSQFDLPETLDGLKSITKPQSSKDNRQLKEAFKALTGASEWVTLQRWVKYLRDHTFQSNIEELKNIE